MKFPLQSEVKNEQGLLHNTEGPAYVFETSASRDEFYYLHGILARCQGPSILSYTKKKGKLILTKEQWITDDRGHREDGPAVITYNLKGRVLGEEYIQNGFLHREDGPAILQWSDNGDLLYAAYYVNGKRHRVDGPAVAEYALCTQQGYQKTRIATFEAYYQHNELHHMHGPAVCTRSAHKAHFNVLHEAYYVKGEIRYGGISFRDYEVLCKENENSVDKFV